MSFSDRSIDFINRKNAQMYALCDDWAKELENQAKIKAPWKDRTGHARQSLHGDMEASNSKYRISLSHGVEYGAFLEEGTAPHIIRPVNKKALYWRGAEHPVKLVHHPGTQPKAIVGPTMKENKYRIRDTVLKLWGD